ncbi:hypothetical protein JXB41_08645 [Candidatus Woesearchaeota archaeon]|nr:hypothetical protein [Candidatus Woesearchaeota archaeon]
MKKYNYINKRNYSISKIYGLIEQLKKLNIIIIGDAIIDEYVFVTPKGRAIKDPILSVEFNKEERYAGGILAIANHISSYVNNITLLTLIGNQKSNINFIEESLASNIKLITFKKENSPTTIKRRYIDSYRNNKLFKIEYMNDRPIPKNLTNKIIEYLSTELPKYDLVIVGDFGHGFINNEIRDILEEKSKFLSLNVQSNSANMGYNYVNHYKKPDFLCMGEQEIRLPVMSRFEEMEEVIIDFYNKFNYPKFMVTQGKNGSIFFNKGELFKAPALVNTVIDTVGAGDALFAISSLFAYLNVEPELLLFIANCAGGIKANIMGNKEPVTKDKLINFIEEIYNGLEQL